jgi:S-adenosylmethionine:tRNA ribosyltransferase-isomerase
MKLSKFKFELDPQRIALHPSDNRDESKLMVLNRKDGTIKHKLF